MAREAWKTGLIMKHSYIILFLVGMASWACNTEVKVSDSCGDDFMDPGEECDGTDLGGLDCLSVGGYDPDAQLSCNPDCTLNRTSCGSFCGDGIVDTEHGERCDSGNLNGQSCQSLNFTGGALTCDDASCDLDTRGCTTLCGNGLVETGEPCDDGNELDGDGCDSACVIEEGFYCEGGSPSDCGPVCGDLSVVGDETCDGENLDGQSCVTLGWHDGELACSEDCRLDTVGCESAGRCGDGVVQPEFEACDGDDLFGASCASSGFSAGALACDAGCALDTSACTTCGNAVIEDGEQCEGTNFGTATCQNLGFTGGTLACDGACQRDTGGCYYASCPDGDIDPGEDCEPPSNLNDQTCATRGFVSGTLTCNSNCTFNLSNCSMCGNDAVDSGENCDGTDLGGQTCATLGYTAGALSCNANCTLNTLACTTCGNAVIENGEQCEGTNLNGQTCSTQGFYSGTLACAGSCFFSTAGCTNCGNGVINAGEDCDAGNVGGADCTDADYPGGTIGCTNATCTFSVANCWRWTRISAGGAHTCGVRSDGTAWCWGAGNYGQLGRNSTLPSSIPAAVSNLTNVTDIAAGQEHTCARLGTGALHCWGRNTYGQVGNGTSGNNLLVPVQVISSGVNQFEAGSTHTCARTTLGALFCWGYNKNGRLGDGTTTDRLAPTQIYSSGVSQVAVGSSHTCVIKTDGSAFCWGNNTFGQLGDGTTTERLTPTQVSGVTSGATQITAGGSHTCAIGNGAVACWGRNNFGQLGINNTTDQDQPTVVTRNLTSGATRVSAGSSHTCAVKNGYGTYCWGYNGSGQLGINSITNQDEPMLIVHSPAYSLVEAGFSHTCTIDTNFARCWGENADGQIGNGGSSDAWLPTLVQ